MRQNYIGLLISSVYVIAGVCVFGRNTNAELFVEHSISGVTVEQRFNELSLLFVTSVEFMAVIGITEKAVLFAEQGLSPMGWYVLWNWSCGSSCLRFWEEFRMWYTAQVIADLPFNRKFVLFFIQEWVIKTHVKGSAFDAVLHILFIDFDVFIALYDSVLQTDMCGVCANCVCLGLRQLILTERAFNFARIMVCVLTNETQLYCSRSIELRKELFTSVGPV